MSDSARPLPPEFAHPQVHGLLLQGRTRGYVTSGDVRSAVEGAGVPLSRTKAVLRSLSEEGVSVMVEADSTREQRPARATVLAATAAAKRATA